MAKRKGVSGARKRRANASKQKSSSSLGSNSNSTSIAKESPSDWLTSIQTEHVTNDKNVEEKAETPLLLETIKNGLESDSITPEIQLDTSSQEDYELDIDSIADDEGVDQAGTCKSPKNGLKPNRFYGSKLYSYKFSFQKSSKAKNEKKVENLKLQNEERKEKCRSVKRKHKAPQDQESVNHVVKKAKKDTSIAIKEKVLSTIEKSPIMNGVCSSSNRCVIPGALGVVDKEGDSLRPDVSANHKNDSTVLDLITPESSTSSPMSEDPLSSVSASNGLTNGYHHYYTTSDSKLTISDTKTIIDEVVSELGSLHSEESITSGLGSVRASSLLKGQKNEYYFSSSSENSPDLTANGPSKFIETPKSSLASPDSDIESEDSCTRDINKRPFLYYGKNGSESSYSPSGSSASRISPEHQTSITSFFKKSTKQVSTTSPKSKKAERANKKGKESKKKMEQMYLDLGQRDFGHVTCTTCGMVYMHAQPDDEIEHIRHHKKFVNGLRFKGWKDEHVVKEFHDGRIIMVKSDDHTSHLKKVEEIRKVVDSELGFAVDLPYRKNESKTFLFIANKRVVGCCVATQIDKGYPVLPSTPTKDSTPDRQIAAWCCSTVPVPAQCGISKIWVWNQYRRKKVATRLIDCVRSDFIYGCNIAKEALAFSDPTPDGKRLASTYCGTQEFLVFR